MEYRGQDLFEEKSLWAVYKICVLRLRRSRFNTFLTLISFLALSVYAIFGSDEKDQAVSTVRALADMGLGYGTTILGFLIAGFTIFATLTKEKLLRDMYDNIHESGLNYVKVNFYSFIEVFIVFLAFIIVCLFVKIFAFPHGPLTEFVLWLNGAPFFSYRLEIAIWKKISLVFFGTFAVYALMTLKSFVYNTHHAVMTLIVWSLGDEEQSEKK